LEIGYKLSLGVIQIGILEELSEIIPISLIILLVGIGLLMILLLRHNLNDSKL